MNSLALREIERARREGRPILVAFSGGKDSLAALTLVSEVVPSGGVEAFIVEVPGNTHVETIRYVKEVSERFGVELRVLRADQTIWEAIRKWGFPSPRRRWCATFFKMKVVKKFLSENYEEIPLVITGEKRSDSKRRKNLPPIERRRDWGQVTVHPVLEWTDEEVIRYLTKKGVNICPLYHRIGASGGCLYCPFKTKRTYWLAVAREIPWIVEKISSLEEETRGKAFLIKGKPVSIRELVKEP